MTYFDFNSSPLPEMLENCENLQTWDWVFAKTPKFTVKRGIIQHLDGFGLQDFEVEIDVNKGLIEDVRICSKSIKSESVKQLETTLCSILCTRKFSKSVLNVELSKNCGNNVENWIRQFILHEMIGT